MLLFDRLQSIEISSCAQWESNGVTILGTGVAGSSPKDLNEPVGLSIYERTKTLYIADHYNARIQMLALDDSTGVGTTVISDVYFPLHVHVDDDEGTPTIYVSLSVDSRVEKWVTNASEGIQIGDACNDCLGVSVDQEKNVYIADTSRQRVIKWSPKTNETSTIAGIMDQSGSNATFLSTPEGIYVTRTGDRVYVADTGNSRVQLWMKNAKEGVTVAGSIDGIEGNSSASLRAPIGILVDERSEVIYVADTSNNRIMRWLPNAVEGELIVGLGGQGNHSDQLSEPTDLAIDSDGHLYVSDLKNHRVQRFRLRDNSVCPSFSSSSKLSLSTVLLLLSLFVVQLN